MARTFEDKPAVRERVPLWLGLFGASGSGKSYSALRLAEGIQRVFPGEIFAIDTEAGRLLHYATAFKFRHLEFKAPFGPSDYVAAIQHCMAKKPSVIVVDSMSHVWEGPGGVLEMAEASGRTDAGKWLKPKSEHRKMIDALLQMRMNFVFCFRARSKIKPVKGGQPIDLGYQPIGSDELVFEMLLNCLLPPASDGVPTWTPEFQGERAMLKLPEMFREMFAKNPPPQLTQDIGEQLARWAAGDEPAAQGTQIKLSEGAGLIDAYAECVSEDGFAHLEKRRAAIWKSATTGQKEQLKAAADKAKARLEEGAKA